MSSDPYLLPHIRRSSSSGNLQTGAASSGLGSSSVISYWQLYFFCCFFFLFFLLHRNKRQTDRAAPHKQSWQSQKEEVGCWISGRRVRSHLTYTRLVFTRGWFNWGTTKDCLSTSWGSLKSSENGKMTLKKWLKSTEGQTLNGSKGDVADHHVLSYGPARVQMIQLLDIHLLWEDGHNDRQLRFHCLIWQNVFSQMLGFLIYLAMRVRCVAYVTPSDL